MARIISTPDGSLALSPDRAITENERAWIAFIRLASRDSDPSPTLRRVQRLRRIFEPDPAGPDDST